MKSVYLALFVLIAFFIASCDSEEVNSDPNYPTTINALTTEAIDQILVDLGNTPLHCTSVDTFGHCYITLKSGSCKDLDSNYIDYSYEEIADSFYETILNYGDFINESDTTGIRISSIRNLKGMDFEKFITTYPDSATQGWIVTSNKQTFNGYEIPGTEIKLLIDFDRVRAIEGKRYKELYLPLADIYNETLAKQQLFGKEYTSGSKTMTIDEETYWYKAEKIIFPITKSDKIELRVCWALHPEDWLIIVDSQTGEILTSVNLS
jgi:hypothetical protein